MLFCRAVRLEQLHGSFPSGRSGKVSEDTGRLFLEHRAEIYTEFLCITYSPRVSCALQRQPQLFASRERGNDHSPEQDLEECPAS